MKPNKIVFRLQSYPDGSGLYWTPKIVGGDAQDVGALEFLAKLGFSPDTDGTEVPPEFRGWIYNESIGDIIFALAGEGVAAIFIP